MPFFSAFVTFALLSASVISDTGRRQIILYASDTGDSLLIRQQAILAADPAGLKERQVLVSVRIGITVEHPGSGFLFVLYGKDGGKKFSSDKPVEIKTLYGVIDSMPMRREEVNRKRQT